jgi:hypothetical protein
LLPNGLQDIQLKKLRDHKNKLQELHKENPHDKILLNIIRINYILSAHVNQLTSFATYELLDEITSLWNQSSFNLNSEVRIGLA